MSLIENVNLDQLLISYFEKLPRNIKNINRVKKFYTNEDTFDMLMNRIIDKDYDRIEKLLNKKKDPNLWSVFFVILEIVQSEGNEIEPYDAFTRIFASKTISYMGWTFSWVHGENDMLSIYNRYDELIYRI